MEKILTFGRDKALGNEGPNRVGSIGRQAPHDIQ